MEKGKIIGSRDKKHGRTAPGNARPSFRETTRSLFMEPVDISPTGFKPPRIDELDLLRGYAIFGFIIYHVVLILGSETVVDDSLLGFMAFVLFWPIGGKAFFQIGIGIYLVYARSSTRTLVKRGLAILAAGYALNMVRFLPVIVGILRGTLVMEDFPLFRNVGDIIFCADIFQFAGLAFLAYALIRKLFRGMVKPIHWIYMSLGVILISPFLAPLLTGNIHIDRFLEPLWGYGKHIWFPFFPTFCYTLLGAMFGCMLIKIKSFRNHELSFMILSTLTFALGILLTDFFRQPSASIYFKILGPDFVYDSPEVFIKVMGYTTFQQAIAVCLNLYVSKNIIFRFYRYMSYNITAIFVWQWIIIGWITGIYFRAFWQQNVTECVVVIAITTVLAIILTELTKKIGKGMKNRAPRKENPA
ncbi:MAG: DUF1624 domain-containing protein [Firmicutes bacterium]|nr:DUF1624 domain-containing protein [Bacillota bacterium]